MSLPRQNSQLVDADGRPTREFYTWMRGLMAQTAEAEASAPAVGDLSDVVISSLTDGDTLIYDNSIGRWVNGAGGGGGGYDEGTSFPGSPATGDKFYRTDLNWLCFYDGTQWLTCHEYCVNFNRTGDHPTGSGGVLLAFRASMPSDYVAYFTNAYISVEAGSSPHNGSNYTTLSLYTLGSTNTTSVTLATQLTNGGITANTTAKYDISINTSCPITDTRLILTATHTGTITNAYVYPMVNYRLIVT